MSQQPWRDSLRFLSTFLRRPRVTGSVLPSSRHLARALVGELDLRSGELVVEFGPGTGPMTAAIQSRLPSEWPKTDWTDWREEPPPSKTTPAIVRPTREPIQRS